jgi:hypothetical protein
MTYCPSPEWAVEDQTRESDLVQAYRGIVKALRDRKENAEDAQALLAWRWRMDHAIQEARDTLVLLNPEDALAQQLARKVN